MGGSTEDHGSMGSTEDHGSMGSTEDHGSTGSTEDHGSMGTTESSMEGGSTPVDMTNEGSTPVDMTEGPTTPSSSSTDGVCFECIEILGNDMYTGKYTKLDGPAQCPTSCDYMKENDERIWCFKPGNYDYEECLGGSEVTGMSTTMSPHGSHSQYRRNVRDILKQNRFHGK